MPKVTVIVVVDPPIVAGTDVTSLSLDDLVRVEPKADALVRAVRSEIGCKIKDARTKAGLSLEQVRDLTNREIDSAGLSRLERGQAWSADLAATAVAFLKAYPRKVRKAIGRSAKARQ